MVDSYLLRRVCTKGKMMKLKNYFINLSLAAALTLPFIFYSKNHADNVEVRLESMIKTAQQEPITEANQYLRAFPVEIPGESVVKYETAGAKKVLVHIRQSHFHEEIVTKMSLDYFLKGLDAIKRSAENPEIQFSKVYNVAKPREQLEKEGREILAHQNAIFECLSSIKPEQRWILCLEGSLSDHSANDNLQEYIAQNERIQDESAIDDFPRRRYFNCPWDDESKLIFCNQEDRKQARDEKQQWNKYKNFVGAGLAYSIEHDVPTLACEDEEAMKMALDDLEFNLSLDGRGLSKHSEMGNILDGREDGVLKVVSEHNSPIIVLVYGSNHSFGGKQSFPSYDYDRRTVPNKDNIYEWNQENPDKMFSLIEIRVP